MSLSLRRDDGSSRIQERRPAATPETYQRVFLMLDDGKVILEDLVARFHDRPIYVEGGEEAARETQRRAAQQTVIRFILGRLGQVTEQPKGTE